MSWPVSLSYFIVSIFHSDNLNHLSFQKYRNVQELSTNMFNPMIPLIIFLEVNIYLSISKYYLYQVSSFGFIPLVIASIGLHKLAMDVVKSACHTLAILSDVKGQASNIAFAGASAINGYL